MTASNSRRPWTCRRCGHVNERAHVLCRGDGCDGKRPRKRRAWHASVLHGDTYATFVEAAERIHGVTDESCCVCGKPKPEGRRWDRDHDHATGRIRGLACAGNRGCNVLMLPWVSAPVAVAIALAKVRHGEPDAARWSLVADYLTRVDNYYREGE